MQTQYQNSAIKYAEKLQQLEQSKLPVLLRIYLQEYFTHNPLKFCPFKYFMLSDGLHPQLPTGIVDLKNLNVNAVSIHPGLLSKHTKNTIDFTIILRFGADTIVSSLTWNIQTPGIPTLLVESILIISAVRDAGTAAKFTPSPALNPTCAGVPPKPSVPLDASPVVH